MRKAVKSVEVNTNTRYRRVEIWLTRTEQKNEILCRQLSTLYPIFKKHKYTVAVFLSGDGDLLQSTSNLLRYNKRRIAELEK